MTTAAPTPDCKACRTRTKRGFEGQCPACAAERTRRERTVIASCSSTVFLDYTNWKGERRTRRVTPITVDFTSTEWHPEPQWLLTALDLDKGGEVRTFAMKDIHSWKAQP